MEAILVLIVIGIPLLAVIGAVLGTVALVRTRRLEAAVTALRTRLVALESTHAAAAGATEPALPPQPDLPEPEPIDTTADQTAQTEPPPLPTRDGGAPRMPAAGRRPDALDDSPPTDTVAQPAAPSSDQPPPPADDTQARPTIDWEQWIGVRGAAVVGAGALGLAGLLLFKYSVEQGLLSPQIRVIAAVLTGLASILGSEPLRRRSPAGANALAAGGIVVLYGAVWAANTLYSLVAAIPAVSLMVLITLVCGVLAVRRPSQVIAVIGLAGGFATPLLVAPTDAGPFGLFSYILLLDAGILWLALRQRWPVLGALAMLGTGLHQALWILVEMDAATAVLGLGVLGVFTVVFLATTGTSTRATGLAWRITEVGALVVPFLLALRFAGDTDLQPPAQLAALVVLLVLSGVVLGWRQNRPGMANGSIAGALGVVGVWLVNLDSDPTGSALWIPVAIVAALPLIAQLAVELSLRAAERPSTADAVLLASLGGSCLLVVATATHSEAVWPFLVAWIVHATVLVRHGLRLPERGWTHLAAGLILGIGTLAVVPESDLPPTTVLVVFLALAVLAQLVVLALRQQSTVRWTVHGAGAATAAMLFGTVLVPVDAQVPGAVVALATAAILGLGLLLVATHGSSGGWAITAVVMTALVHLTMVSISSTARGTGAPALAVLAAAVVLFSAWPLLTGVALRSTRRAWYGAAAAGPLWFLPMAIVWKDTFGDDALGLLPVGLAAVSVAMLASVRAVWKGDDPVRTEAVVWFAAAALGLVSIAVPLQLEREWITVGWAINAVAVLALWRRLDHAGLKYLGLVLLAAVTVRLVANPWVLSYHSAGGTILINWLAYTYLIPAVALLASAGLLRRFEVARLRSWEPARPFAAPACGLAAVAVIFVWINLAIVHAFTASGSLQLTLERLPARDLTTSLAWAGYAVVLLVLGLSRSSRQLRWVSLALLVVTILKVFLHDLGELEDLYRVASLVGLAGSLIAVSIFYQRFAFRTHPEPGAASDHEGDVQP